MKSATRTLVFFITVIACMVILVTLLPKAAEFTMYLLWLILPFIISYILSLILNPMVDGLEKRFKLPRGISSALVIVFAIGIVGGIIFAIFWKIFDEIKNVVEDWQNISENILSAWEKVSQFFADFIAMLPQNLQNGVDSLSEYAMSLITDISLSSDVFGVAGDFAKGLPGIFIASIVFILSLYFMMTDSKKVSAVLRRPFSSKFLEKSDKVRTEIKHYVGGYIKAQLIIMCISFTIILIGLSILNIKYAPLIALGIAFLDALPFFGSGAVLWPWAVVAFIMGETVEGIGVIIIYLAVILMRQFVEPKIVSKNIGINPFVTLMSMYIGFKIFSIGGMILGPIVMVMIVSFYRTGVFDGFITSVKVLFKKFGREIKNLTTSLSDKENDDE